jgi:hypothetical protein
MASIFFQRGYKAFRRIFRQVSRIFSSCMLPAQSSAPRRAFCDLQFSGDAKLYAVTCALQHLSAPLPFDQKDTHEAPFLFTIVRRRLCGPWLAVVRSRRHLVERKRPALPPAYQSSTLPPAPNTRSCSCCVVYLSTWAGRKCGLLLLRWTAPRLPGKGVIARCFVSSCPHRTTSPETFGPSDQKHPWRSGVGEF